MKKTDISSTNDAHMHAPFFGVHSIIPDYQIARNRNTFLENQGCVSPAPKFN